MPTGFNIGPFTVRYYAILIIMGVLLAAWIAYQQAKKAGRDPEIILDVLPWILIGGIVGARLWHVFTPSASNIAQGVTTTNYLKNPLEILKIWNGGLGIPGGVIGGALALIIYTRVKKIDFWEWADFIAPGLLVAQAVGRWGNFVNQEVYGGPSNLPWAITIEPRFRISGFENTATYHPLFFYEALLNLIAAIVLLVLHKKIKEKLYKGDLFLLYLVFYPTIRFYLEFLRLDPSPVNGININQTTMLVVALLAVAALILKHSLWATKFSPVKSGSLDLSSEINDLTANDELIPETISEVKENLQDELFNE